MKDEIALVSFFHPSSLILHPSYNAPMQSHGKRWAWRLVKMTLALLILFFIGRLFYGDLSRLDFRNLPWRPGWLLLSAGLYLAGLFASAWFWQYLLGVFGYPISLYASGRAHYIGQLGKYVPGKALAVLMRSELVHPLGVPYGVSIIVSFYEVFTGMAAGALVAALIYLFDPPVIADLEWHPLWTGVALLGLCGVPLLPGVFNFVIGRLTAKIQAVELYRLPPIRFGTLAAGLLATGVSWWLHGLSVWAILVAVLPEPPQLTLSSWARCTADIAFANVAGF